MRTTLSLSPIFKKHQNNLVESYSQFLGELREDIEEGHQSDTLSLEFQEEFKIIISNSVLDEYDPLKFYWLNLIDRLIELIEVFEEGHIESTGELIAAFSDSDLLGFVVEQLESGNEAEVVMEQVLELQEIQIISFFHLHLSQEDWIPEGPVGYRLVSELGEGSGHLFLGKNKAHFFISEFVNENIIPICSYSPQKGEIQIFHNQEVKKLSITEAPMLRIDDILCLPGIKNKSHNLSTEHFEKLQWAYNTIKNTLPELYSFLNKFTSTVIPLYQEELVSFSMEVLPSYSSINMDNRDRIDLIDDLLHENGHHFLNFLLEGEEEIIFEDDDKIFYSPWRKSLRPIRGIFHGMATFYWAYRVFKELSFLQDIESFFTSEEISKIYFRFLEESILLKYCYLECNRAFKLEKISPFGMEIINTIYEEIKEDKKLEEAINCKLKPELIEELNRIELDIKKNLTV